MPQIDRPLEELQFYQGVNPRPADHGEYWARALAELDRVDPQIDLKPAIFQSGGAECFDLYFTGVRGARIYAKYLRPRNTPRPHPAVLNFHGYSGNSGDWFHRLGYISEGIAVASMDCRGQGGKSGDTGGSWGNTQNGHIIRGLSDHPDRLLFRDIFLDTALLARIIMGFSEVDPGRVGAYGGSQGGALTLACAALEPRIRRAAPIYPFLCDFKRVWQMDQAKDAYQELRTYFRNFDPTHQRENEIFTRLGYIDIQFLAPRIQAQVLMGTGLMDTICPPSTQFAAYNKITSQKEMVVYPDFGHEELPGFHDKTFQFFREL